MKTPWRKLLYKELSKITLEGRVLDLGGVKDAEYHNLFQGKHAVTVANIENAHGYDVYCDVEKTFPITDGSYDAITALNLLEHVYNYQNVLSEARRVLVSGGKIVLAVPFLMPVHPSPHDYWRFTGESLTRIMEDAGFESIEVHEVGRGPWTASAQITFNGWRVMPLRALENFCGMAVDWFIGLVDPKEIFGKTRYPLGYVVIGKKK